MAPISSWCNRRDSCSCGGFADEGVWGRAKRAKLLVEETHHDSAKAETTVRRGGEDSPDEVDWRWVDGRMGASGRGRVGDEAFETKLYEAGPAWSANVICTSSAQRLELTVNEVHLKSKVVRSSCGTSTLRAPRPPLSKLCPSHRLLSNPVVFLSPAAPPMLVVSVDRCAYR
ncbi:hypothetical protein BDZ90DRAFT_177403 [Jaminaea rosea]|uniref:Uncharacterized protein n=1 Tax=Jaminaea rosea TaxID=1569628 RepID=A0A316UQ15_9BASI|nr:hypothetical protein BDZ90DRAFT_177403 [Jaminaea rosea]PWN27402.1 hypothetical protein BDZ90DRAFT_177403 [Jaminaea rosea]